MLKNIYLHFKLITKHRWCVFKLAVKAGIPFRGLMHDLSKYSPREFIESCKFYDGKCSPITKARMEQGYSKAWLHHRNKNKHHIEYWYDYESSITPVLPYGLTVEILCDHIAAGMVYQGKNWNKEYTLKYWNEVETNRNFYNKKTEKFLTVIKEEIASDGLEKVMKRKHLKEQYEKYCK